MRGARAVQESIINKFPITKIDVSLVWLEMLPGDSEAAAKKEAGNFKDQWLCQYYDPDKRSGKAIAESLGYVGKVAWDIYLFYAAGAEWIENPPPPSSWLHQLSENWIDRERYHTGDDLGRELFGTMKKLLQLDSTPYPKP
ncbi:MAG: hypothetical protein JSU83_09180 [Deltaproteobacteria bacterium]|nr:MAG: hypothetical protein JSU83_09180 [Deltaproteobacteria bacterium]